MQAIGLPVEGFRGFRRFKRLKAGKRQARMPKQEKAMCRQRAGCNAGTLTAAPPLPGSFQVSWVILLANGRNLVPPVEGFRGFRRFKRLKAGKRQARMP